MTSHHKKAPVMPVRPGQIINEGLLGVSADPEDEIDVRQPEPPQLQALYRRLSRELEMMNSVWTSKERLLFLKGCRKYGKRCPYAISTVIKTKNVLQVSRRLYILEKLGQVAPFYTLGSWRNDFIPAAEETKDADLEVEVENATKKCVEQAWLDWSGQRKWQQYQLGYYEKFPPDSVAAIPLHRYFAHSYPTAELAPLYRDSATLSTSHIVRTTREAYNVALIKFLDDMIQALIIHTKTLRYKSKMAKSVSAELVYRAFDTVCQSYKYRFKTPESWEPPPVGVHALDADLVDAYHRSKPGWKVKKRSRPRRRSTAQVQNEELLREQFEEREKAYLMGVEADSNSESAEVDFTEITSSFEDSLSSESSEKLVGGYIESEESVDAEISVSSSLSPLQINRKISSSSSSDEELDPSLLNMFESDMSYAPTQEVEEKEEASSSSSSE